MKVYKGKRLEEVLPDECLYVMNVKVIVIDNGEEKPLYHRIRHSPTGIEWGYLSSGPADLALSILWDFMGKEPEQKLYMRFKEQHVARWGDEWEISEKEIYDFLEWEAEAEFSGS